MALWQFKFKIIPKDIILDKLSEIWDSFSWINHNLSSDLVNQLESILNLHEVYGDYENETKVFGNPEINDITIYYEDAQPVEIMIRLDVRDLDFPLLDRIIEVLRLYDCVIMTDNEEVLIPSKYDIIRAITDSEAVKFSISPIEYLKNYRNN